MSESNALIAEVRVSLTSPANVFVEYDNPLAGRYRTRLEARAAEHTISIVRLRPETTYDYTIFTASDSDESKAVRGPSGSFTTGALPEPLASVFTMATGRSSQPLILSGYNLQKDSYFILWDEVGALVWHLRVEHASAVARLPGSEDFLFGIRHDAHACGGCRAGGGLRRFTPLGRVTHLARDIAMWHHDLVPLDDGRVLFPLENADDFGNGDQQTRVAYDSIVVWHSTTGRTEEVWNAREAWDIFTPLRHWGPGDHRWTHLNSVTPGGHGNLLLSVRNRSQVVSLKPNYKIEWQLHGPESDYEFPDPNDRFHKQHTASQLANGNILLFDNGNGRPDTEGGEYSRALELRLDDAAGTAVKVWEYRHRPDIYAPYASSAYRLDGGHTLVNFGTRRGEHAKAPRVVVEVDANGEEVFRVEAVHLHQRTSRYRAQGGIKAIYGETMLRPPTAFVQSPPPVRLHYERMKHVAAEAFNLYLEDRHLVYAKAPCTAEDIALPFFLHVYPKRHYLLKEDRREFGFDNLDFKFFQRGLRWEGGCHAEVPLPHYEIDRIATGQSVAEDDATDASAAAAWRVEIHWGRDRGGEGRSSTCERPCSSRGDRH